MSYAAYAPPLPAEPGELGDLNDALQEVLSKEGFHEFVETSSRKQARVQKMLAPLFAICAFTFTLMLADPISYLGAFIASLVGVYVVSAAAAFYAGLRGSRIFLGLLLLAWIVAAVVQVTRGGIESLALTHVAPVVIVTAFLGTKRIARGLPGAMRGIPLLFGIVLLVLFIPLFTQELWATIPALELWQAALVVGLAVAPVLIAVYFQILRSITANFCSSAVRLERENTADRAAKALIRARTRRPLTLSLAPAIERTPDRLLSLVRGDALRTPQAEWLGRLQEAFSPPCPSTYASRIARRVKPRFRWRVRILLPLFVASFTTLISAYIYALAALAIDAETARGWAHKDVPHWEIGLGGLVDAVALPVGPYLAVSAFLGVVATAIFLGLTLTDDRYSKALADAIIHSEIDRCLLFLVPHYYVRAPSNDWFGNPEKLSGLKVNASGSNRYASREPDEGRHAGNHGAKSVWYSWEVPTTGRVTIDTAGSSFDTVLAVYVGTELDRLTQVAANGGSDVLYGSTAGRPCRVTFNATAGTVYSIAVDGRREDSGFVQDGDIQLNCTAASPANDNFDAPRVLEGRHGVVRANNLNATLEPDELPHGSETGERSVWFAWEAPQTGEAVFDTRGSEFHALVAVYTGSRLAELKPVASSDFMSTRLWFDVEAGIEYRIAVDSYAAPDDSPLEGAITLAYWCGAPVNDRFARPKRLRGSTGSTRGANIHAAHEEGEPRHAGSGVGRSVWYRWTAESTGLTTFDTAGSTFDTVLAVYTGESLARLDEVASNDDESPATRTSRVEFDAVAGTEYRIAVDGYPVEPADGWILLQWVSPPPNDRFASAAALSGERGSTSGTTEGATKEADEPNHDGKDGGRSIWYRWRAPADGHVRFDTEDSTFDTVLAVYTGDQIGDLDRITSNDDTSPATRTSRVSFEAKSGTEYLIAVDGYRYWDGEVSAGTVRLSWEPEPPLPD